MAEYILQILRSQLMVVCSWGFHNPTALPNDMGLSFMVDGFKYQGRVYVYYNEGTDSFDICLEGSAKEEGVYLDNLVSVIDGMVERCDNYHQRVEREYCLEY